MCIDTDKASDLRMSTPLAGLPCFDDIIRINAARLVSYLASLKLLGIMIDSQLHFQSHVEAICKTENQKVKAFSRIAGYLQKHKAYVLYKTFIRSTFNYCPLIWMSCGKTANNRINKLHKRALRVLQNDYTATFEGLLEKSKEVTVHCSNLQKLMIKIYECTKYIGLAVLTEFFTTKEISYDLRIKNLLQIPKVKTS